jgi:Respiratory-chain NADH dehydrogenase 51 Kd subunit
VIPTIASPIFSESSMLYRTLARGLCAVPTCLVALGITDPLSLADYEQHGGWRGLRAAIAMHDRDIVEQVTASGLRGRGGAAFPAGIKWRTVLTTAADQKYVVCNADEGDSGASRMKRRLREGARLIVFDPRAIDVARTPHVEATHLLQLRPGTNVALINAFTHTIVTEGLHKEDHVRARCDIAEYRSGRRSSARSAIRPRPWRRRPACRRPRSARQLGSTPARATPRSTTASASPSTARARPW